MRKTALAVAVGGLFIAPAAQAQIVFGNETLGTVQLYGKRRARMEQLAKQAPRSNNSTVLINDSVRTERKTEICGAWRYKFCIYELKVRRAAARIESNEASRPPP